MRFAWEKDDVFAEWKALLRDLTVWTHSAGAKICVHDRPITVCGVCAPKLEAAYARGQAKAQEQRA